MERKASSFSIKPLCVLAGLLIGLCCASATRAQDEKKPDTPPADAGAKVQIDIDYSQTPELKDWVDKELRPALEAWYPIIVGDLPSQGYAPPNHFTVTIETPGSGVAYTAGTRVVVSATWIKSQNARGPQNEAVGSLIHEEVHVVQQYGRARGPNRAPGWLTEGIADYIRWYKFEPVAVRTRVRPIKSNGQPASYKDSYRTTAAFLEFVAKNYDHEIVVKLNAAARDGVYTPDLWKLYTGKTADELWAAFVDTLQK